MKTCVRYVGGMTARKRCCGKPATKKVTTNLSSSYILMNMTGDFVCEEHAKEMIAEYRKHKLFVQNI